MAKTYVPGYGYVDSDGPGTRGSVKPGPKKRDTGQNPNFTPFQSNIPPGFYLPPEDALMVRADLNPLSLEFGSNPVPKGPGLGDGTFPDNLEDVVVDTFIGDGQGKKFTNEALAESVAGEDGYVVETSPGVYEVKYGIWAANAAAQNVKPNSTAMREYVNPATVRNLPGNEGMGRRPGEDATIIGSTYDAADPYIAVDRDPREYVIYTDQAQIPTGAGEMDVTTYEKLKDKQDATAMGVFMGTFTTAGTTGSTAVDVVKDSRIVSDYTMLSDREQEEVLKLTAQYYSGMPWQFSWIEKRWAKAVSTANKRLMLYGEKVTPFEVYDRMIANEKARDAEKRSTGGGYSGGGGFGGGGGGTSTIRLTSATDARVILNQAMKTYLGRDATGEEIDKFVGLLNAKERANPIVQEYSGNTALQYGGFNPATFAEDFARSKDGSSEYQAVTTFLDAFMGALDGDMGVI
jgi:hypothetical protein